VKQDNREHHFPEVAARTRRLAREYYLAQILGALASEEEMDDWADWNSVGASPDMRLAEGLLRATLNVVLDRTALMMTPPELAAAIRDRLNEDEDFLPLPEPLDPYRPRRR
jgi:hypothetical protein